MVVVCELRCVFPLVNEQESGRVCARGGASDMDGESGRWSSRQSLDRPRLFPSGPASRRTHVSCASTPGTPHDLAICPGPSAGVRARGGGQGERGIAREAGRAHPRSLFGRRCPPRAPTPSRAPMSLLPHTDAHLHPLLTMSDGIEHIDANPRGACSFFQREGSIAKDARTRERRAARS